MQYLKVCLLIAATMISTSLFAERAWIGKVKVKAVSFYKSSADCGADGGACLKLTFEDGFQGCKSIAIRETDDHFKHIESMAYISLTSGKNLRVYASNEYCDEADSINVNKVELYD